MDNGSEADIVLVDNLLMELEEKKTLRFIVPIYRDLYMGMYTPNYIASLAKKEFLLLTEVEEIEKLLTM